MRTFVALVAVICATSALSLDHQFNLFKIQHAKKYDSDIEVGYFWRKEEN